MKILWQSNSRRAPTGYGNQTNLFVPELKRAGHDMSIFAFYGQEGTPALDADDILTLPRLIEPYGADVIESHMAYTKAELLVTLIDPFALNWETYRRLPWCAWAPIDSTPPFPPNIEALRAARWIWAMSRFGQNELASVGLKSDYVPHGVNTDVFRPVDRDEARDKVGKFLGVELRGKFLIVMNAANKGVPSRKGFSEALEAFKIFLETHPDSVLYIHTELQGIWQGEDLRQTIRALGIDGTKIIFPPQYQYVMGMLSPALLNDIYNAADVFLSTSHGEGFGIPIIEAQAAGCPVIVPLFSSMEELLFSGAGVSGTLFAHNPGTRQIIPNVGEVVRVLRLIHEMQHNDTIHYLNGRQKARERALVYDFRYVLKEYMLPALERIQADMTATASKKAERAALRAKVREAANA